MRELRRRVLAWRAEQKKVFLRVRMKSNSVVVIWSLWYWYNTRVYWRDRRHINRMYKIVIIKRIQYAVYPEINPLRSDSSLLGWCTSQEIQPLGADYIHGKTVRTSPSKAQFSPYMHRVPVFTDLTSMPQLLKFHKDPKPPQNIKTSKNRNLPKSWDANPQNPNHSCSNTRRLIDDLVRRLLSRWIRPLILSIIPTVLYLIIHFIFCMLIDKRQVHLIGACTPWFNWIRRTS